MERHDTKEVTDERFNQVLTPHINDHFSLSLQGWEVALFHGAIKIVSLHPEVQKLSTATNAVLQHWLAWCLHIMQGWGFTREEMYWLDEANHLPDGKTYLTQNDEPPGKGFLRPAERQAIAEADTVTKYPAGIGKIDRGECPRGYVFPQFCVFCPYGHLTECHYPMDCAEARCSHYDIKRE